jgi:hypothetical protein
MFIGRLLGLAIDGGMAMTYKTLHPNNGYVCCRTVRVWMPPEEATASFLAERASFMTQLTDSISPDADPENFPYRDLTPEF